jgi:solute carrier family 8 (sodium/calcium exchanger)|tara:strand:+ start:103 stop:597 length:495 start_codon:yes stop_codon:yes gene_type:complete
VLGASTIVGSAAFNLLVISGVSILAVDDGPKPIKDVGVFFVTATSSLFAYIWLYLVLGVMTKNEVTMVEGWLTFCFSGILIILAYSADRIGDKFRKSEETEEEIAEKDAQMDINICKYSLKEIAKNIPGEHAFTVIVEIAEGISTEHTRQVDEKTHIEIRSLYK